MPDAGIQQSNYFKEDVLDKLTDPNALLKQYVFCVIIQTHFEIEFNNEPIHFFIAEVKNPEKVNNHSRKHLIHLQTPNHEIQNQHSSFFFF